MAVIRTAADVPERPDGRVHFLLHFEGGRPLEGGIGALRMFFRLGLRTNLSEEPRVSEPALETLALLVGRRVFQGPLAMLRIAEHKSGSVHEIFGPRST